MTLNKGKVKKILHLGCGFNKKSGAIGVDILKSTKADIIHDLNVFPYPIGSNQFDEVIAENIMEHLDNVPNVMQEVYRISKNKAKILITNCHFSSVDSFTDPTHRHTFTSRTFDYFIPNTDLYKYRYSGIKFKKIKVILGPQNLKNPIQNYILKIINKNMIFYEKHFAFVFPVGVINFVLEVDKNGKS